MPVGAPSLLATPTLGSNNPSRLLASTSAQSIGNHPACSPLSALEKVPLLGARVPNSHYRPAIIAGEALPSEWRALCASGAPMLPSVPHACSCDGGLRL
eukprot:CAMPEP_0173327144 /NCGR_PEP_ID=MMETSP1144-20121109/1446_1 /TAXON_ID=483371 /ORGANISM="non described non described, Strain CCMP2298" /LENGTH=98 /DNA_ID=CAMNT_0014271509 /DNA_START=274 /DNA_END=571 /DNA_ORIENTATION=+